MRIAGMDGRIICLQINLRFQIQSCCVHLQIIFLKTVRIGMIAPIPAGQIAKLYPCGDRRADGIKDIDMRSRVLSLMPVDCVGTVVPP